MTTNFIETYYPTTSYILDPRDPYNTIYSYFDASGNLIYPNENTPCPYQQGTNSCVTLFDLSNNSISENDKTACGCVYPNLNDALNGCISMTQYQGSVDNSSINCLGVLSTTMLVEGNQQLIPIYMPFSMNPILNTIDQPLNIYYTIPYPENVSTIIYQNNNNPINNQIAVANYNTWLQNPISYDDISSNNISLYPLSDYLPPCIQFETNCSCNSSPCNPSMSNYFNYMGNNGEPFFSNSNEYLAPLYYCPSGNTPYGMNTEPTWALTASGWIIDSSANPILSSSYGCSP